MTLKEQINDDMKSALRAKQVQRLSALRLLLAAIKQREIDERRQLSDAEVVAVIDKMIKQRRESIAQYESGDRPDLAQAERFEITVLQGYMPQPMSEAEIEAAVVEAVRSTGAQTLGDMGKVMALLKPQLTGRADMGKVSALVKARLAG
ncbi:MAG TPA: GatB/YqeY domain-containing protein [Burkholderiales bacterium]|nr:GatB/YqeY domain-containing protein [Burkholderiales bacterium]